MLILADISWRTVSDFEILALSMSVINQRLLQSPENYIYLQNKCN